MGRCRVEPHGATTARTAAQPLPRLQEQLRPALADSAPATDVRYAATEPAGWLNQLVYWTLWSTVGIAVRLLLRTRTEGAAPTRGAAVLTPNHVSFLDPLVIGCVTRRRVTFLMTSVVYRSPWLGWFYRLARAIPLEPRGGNREALRAAREVLARGELLCIFPEGGLSRDGQLMLGQPGAVSLVLGQDVPIVPVGIRGTDHAMPPTGGFRFAPVTLVFGAPLPEHELLGDAANAPRKVRLTAATRAIMDRIGALLGQPSREAWLERRLADAPTVTPE